MGDRKPNLRSSIYQGADGRWHGWVTMGLADDGSPDRRHRTARTEAEVTRKVRALERARDSGQRVARGQAMTVGQWMEIWLTQIAPRRVRRSTLDRTYRSKVRSHIIPGLGRHRLDRLAPEHVERFYTRLEHDGLAPSSVLQIHRILARALKVAVQRGHVTRNVALLVDAQSASPARIEPLTLAEAKALTAQAAALRNGTRWSVALALGLRQGEALGLRWADVDLDAATITIRWQLQRRSWRHSCPDPIACTQARHTAKCPAGCTAHARACPQRQNGGLVLAELKSGASKRVIALAPQLVAALRDHQVAQAAERDIAGSFWHDGGFVWCQPTGKPVNPRADWGEWKALLKAAGVRDARLHDARHTAATLLLTQGVDQRVVMEILGHSQISMTSRYTHVLPQVMTDAAARMRQALWGP
jgi:integrase